STTNCIRIFQNGRRSATRSIPVRFLLRDPKDRSSEVPKQLRRFQFRPPNAIGLIFYSCPPVLLIALDLFNYFFLNFKKNFGLTAKIWKKTEKNWLKNFTR